MTAARNDRRHAFRLIGLSGVVWAAGNALTSGPAMNYLAQDLGAQGLALGFLLAIPSFIGFCRVAAPWFERLLGSSRSACFCFLVASYVLLAALPFLLVSRSIPAPWRLTAVIALISVHQSLEYIGLAAQWSWFGSIVPEKVRGAFFGWRGAAQLLVIIVALFAMGKWVDRAPVKKNIERVPAYAQTTGVGCALLMLSVAPLMFISRQFQGAQALSQARREGEKPARFSHAMLAFLLFSMCFSAANGWTQAAQGRWPKEGLGLSFFSFAAPQACMRFLQMVLSPWLGKWSDRVGPIPVIACCQAIVALGPACYALATKENPSGFWLAWIAYSAYAGHNICMPNLALSLGAANEGARRIAWYQGVSGLVHALATLAGGIALDVLKSPGAQAPSPAVFVGVFLSGTALRWLVIIPLWRVHRQV